MMEALSPANIGLLLFGIFFVLLLIGSPIMVALGVATMACFIVLDIDLSLMIERAFASLTAFPLMALPAFVLAGSLMEAAGVSRRLVHVAENIVGPTPGGLAISTTLSCVFFGAISGSGPATTAAVGMLMIPAMAKRGYNVGYAAAATATAGGIGIIIPPSIPMVIYGVSGQQSISKMFMAGIIPGILIAIGLSVMHFFLCRNLKTEGLDWSMKTFIHSLRDGFWSILAPVIILGGIYAGIFTPTEAAVVAIFYTILVGIFIHKELTLKSFMASLKTTSWLTGPRARTRLHGNGFRLPAHLVPDPGGNRQLDPVLHQQCEPGVVLCGYPLAVPRHVYGNPCHHHAGDAGSAAHYDSIRG